MTLEQVLADARERAQMLRIEGHPAQAASIERVCDDVAAAAEDYLNWLSESEARLRSNCSVAWLRTRFARWAESGLAEQRGRDRYYRAVIVPQRANLEAARAAGRRAAQAS
jgi:hypothetical protein